MRLIHTSTQAQPAVGQVTADGARIRVVNRLDSVRSLSLHAIKNQTFLRRSNRGQILAAKRRLSRAVGTKRVLHP